MHFGSETESIRSKRTGCVPHVRCTQTWGLKTSKTREGSERLDMEDGMERACLGSKHVSTCFLSTYWVPGPGVTQKMVDRSMLHGLPHSQGLILDTCSLPKAHSHFGKW